MFVFHTIAILPDLFFNLWSATVQYCMYFLLRSCRDHGRIPRSWVNFLLCFCCESQVVGTMDPALGGATPGTSTTNIASLGHARGTVLGLKLDKMSDSVTGQTAVNPKGSVKR